MSQQLTLFNYTHNNLTSDDYYTPKHIFDKLQIQFDLDVAAPAGGCHWIPAYDYYDQRIDGLQQTWSGNVFMNPPFSNVTPWVTKFMQHNNGIALLPMAKSKWFDAIWLDVDGFTILPYNLKFVDPRNNRGSIFLACCLVAYGKLNVQALQNINKVR